MLYVVYICIPLCSCHPHSQYKQRLCCSRGSVLYIETHHTLQHTAYCNTHWLTATCCQRTLQHVLQHILQQTLQHTLVDSHLLPKDSTVVCGASQFVSTGLCCCRAQCIVVHDVLLCTMCCCARCVVGVVQCVVAVVHNVLLLLYYCCCA